MHPFEYVGDFTINKADDKYQVKLYSPQCEPLHPIEFDNMKIKIEIKLAIDTYFY